ncbi:hypothetical protein [Arthrobacter woluwensis]|uniref:WXG100 family type VII secretion target n=1 Tax=Arthrobacter woluwensis TaxID=156980 RepID=A0A1H4MA90_9MICC|nr:hypothetical protein [Arthrobacter woluwensis]SEB79956.1 hypothetical protein SAMN04489745_1280 [Arthrobacter woluwensis]
MAPGFYGADVEQLRALSKSMGLSGSRLKNTEMQVNSLVSGVAWKGDDGERFRREWSSTLRPMLHKASQSLSDASKLLLGQADEQQSASTNGGSVGGGPGGGPGAPGGSGGAGGSGGPGSPDAPTGLEGILSVAGSPEWWAGNGLVTGAGLYTDNLLATMAKGGLVTELTKWPWLSAQYGMAAEAGYVKGTQLLNGTSMLGRLSGGLGVVTGGLQFTQGLATGNTGMAIDGGISTVLAAGSFIPGAGPFFAVAGVAWGGMGLLATHLGYGSASEMVADGAKHVWEGTKNVANAVADGAKKTVDAVADGAKKVWGWLT